VITSADLQGYALPALVAVLSGFGGLLGIRFRDTDITDRRKVMWLFMLVLLAGIATSAAINAASGFGRPVVAILLSVAASAVVVGTHVLWRRIAFDGTPRHATIAMVAVGLAVAVIVGSVGYTYVQNKGCRQAQGLISTSMANYGFVIPSLPNQGPSAGDFQKLSGVLRDEANQVTAADVAPQAKVLADIADQIAAAAASGDAARHASLGVQFDRELGALLRKCRNR
jgi:hypothetical protein